MPSGAKRRKAAKKKKQQLSNNSNNLPSSINYTNPQGKDDLRSQDEKDSDGFELSSPSSQDQDQDHHKREHQFNENEESEKRDQSSFVSKHKPVERVTSDAQGSQKVGVEDDSVIKIDMQLNAEQDFESKDISVEYVESAKESNDGEDKSATSSSDNESHSSDKQLKEETHESALDGALCYNFEKVFPEEVSRESRTEKPIKEADSNSIAGIVSTNDFSTPQMPMSEVEKSATGSADVVNQKILDVIEPGLKELDDKTLLKSNDSVPEKNRDENVGASPMVTSDANGSDGKILASSGAHTSEASNDALKTRDTETSEYIETQPLVASAPQITQKTSWLSCCGLFDVFTGSTR